MREIKFRAWLNKDKKMVEVYRIDFNYCIIAHEAVRPHEPKGAYNVQSSIIDFKHLMQFTGLKDKNGKEIYEGDIFDTYVGSNDFPVHKKIIIEMAFGQWGYFEPHYKVGENWVGTYMERECSKINGGIGYIWNPLINFPMSEGVLLASNPKKEEYIYIEVIGNIYENPELLKDK